MRITRLASCVPLCVFLFPNTLPPKDCSGASATHFSVVLPNLFGSPDSSGCEVPLHATAAQVGEDLASIETASAVKDSAAGILHAKVLPTGASSSAVATEIEMSPLRLHRIRRRSIRFLCGSRHNRQRGMLRPAAAAAAEAAAAKKDNPEDAFVLESLRLKDPLVAEPPARRWRTQWFPSFARRSLIPLVRAASWCDVIVEVRDARLPLLSRCNLRVLQKPIPRAVILTHADQASPQATRLWQRHFRRESREAAAMLLHAELMRARKQLRNPGLLRAVSAVCPLAPRLPYLFVDAREAAAVVRVQRLLRNLVKRHRLYQKALQRFRCCCKHAAVAAAAAAKRTHLESAALTEGIAVTKQMVASATAAGESEEMSLSRALLRQRKPLRVLIVGTPNVGKSKLANCLLGRKAARSYRWPGVTRTVNIHRQPPTRSGGGDVSRLFDVVDTPGFLPVHASDRSNKKLHSAQEQRMQQFIGTSMKTNKLSLDLFFDPTHPRPSPNELALLAAFHCLPLNCLFTIEEAAVALGDAFFRVREQLPAAIDLNRVMTRYQLNPLGINKDSNRGVQLLLMLADQRHHSNTGAAAQRLLSDLAQSYLGKHTFELPPSRHPASRSTPAEKVLPQSSAVTGTEEVFPDELQRLHERLRQRVFEVDESDSKSNKKTCWRAQADEGARSEWGWKWTMRRQGQRLSFVLDPSSSWDERAARHSKREQALRAAASQSTAEGPGVLPVSKRFLCASPCSWAVGKQELSSIPANVAEDAQPQLFFKGWLEGW